MRGPPVDRCERCMARRERCFCAGVPRIANATEIVIVRHYGEEHRPSNTARLAALALANSRIVSYGREGSRVPPDDVAGDGTWLLFPEAGASLDGLRPRRLVVLDGTWTQARKMRQRLMRGVPVLALPGPSEALRTMRTPPAPGQMPTLLAIAEALALLEGEAVAAPLRALFEIAVERMTAPGRGTRFLVP